jgi:DNA mismatch repair protein MutL
MPRIRVLPPEIVSKIAAGEVIERPASVVKELLENALDAGATDIEIRLQDAGRSLIRLTDNGSGIGREDLTTLFRRHATSKITDADDLYSIQSLGFRGEALYSICAVSDVVLRSGTASSDTGWEIHCRGLNQISLKPVSAPTGTDIEIRELFFNTPARRKFLKSDTAEYNHVLDIVIPYALLYYDCRFLLVHNERAILDLAPAASRAERAGAALGIPGEHLISRTDDNDRKEMAYELLLGDSNIQRPKKDEQFIFVNGRPVQNRAISFHLNEAYTLLFQRGTYPFYCVLIQVPSAGVDVNVHPTKREVKLQNEQAIALRLRAACERTLMTAGKLKQSTDTLFPRLHETAQDKSAKSAEGTSDAPSPVNAPAQADRTQLTQQEHRILFDSKTQLPAAAQSVIEQSLAEASFVGVLLNKYLLFETRDSLLIVDQHAAHERITYERLARQIQTHTFEIENLLAPILVKVAVKEMLAWESVQKSLEGIGFSTTAWDKETVALHSYPRLIRNPEMALRSVLSGDVSRRVDPEYLARRACRSSVMTGECLHKEEALAIRNDLLACESPLTCPHGRPVIIEIKETSLSKQFLR